MFCTLTQVTSITLVRKLFYAIHLLFVFSWRCISTQIVISVIIVFSFHHFIPSLSQNSEPLQRRQTLAISTVQVCMFTNVAFVNFRYQNKSCWHDRQSHETWEHWYSRAGKFGQSFSTSITLFSSMSQFSLFSPSPFYTLATPHIFSFI